MEISVIQGNVAHSLVQEYFALRTAKFGVESYTSGGEFPYDFFPDTIFLLALKDGKVIAGARINSCTENDKGKLPYEAKFEIEPALIKSELQLKANRFYEVGAVCAEKSYTGRNGTKIQAVAFTYIAKILDPDAIIIEGLRDANIGPASYACKAADLSGVVLESTKFSKNGINRVLSVIGKEDALSAARHNETVKDLGEYAEEQKKIVRARFV